MHRFYCFDMKQVSPQVPSEQTLAGISKNNNAAWLDDLQLNEEAILTVLKVSWFLDMLPAAGPLLMPGKAFPMKDRSGLRSAKSIIFISRLQ